MYSSEG